MAFSDNKTELEDRSCVAAFAYGRLEGTAAVLGATIAVVAIAFSMFHLYAAYFGQGESYLHNTTHLSFIMVLAFILKPLGRGSWKDPLNAWFAVDMFCILGVIFVQLFIYWDLWEFIQRRGFYKPFDMAVGVFMIALVLEATRRALGIVMAALVVFFVCQAMYGSHLWGIFFGPDVNWTFLVNDLFMEEGGLYSIPIAVSATYVVLFILFGAFVMRTGVGELFTDIAYALTGKQAGGPAKAAVVSSAFMASISGSAVSNVATTGTLTIPMMKRIGFPAKFAAAVEACASTGGVFTPPIMGAVAFIMAEFLNVSYWEVARAAALPALVYFVSVLAMVHFRSKRLGLKPGDYEGITVTQALKRRGHLLLPIIILVGAMVLGYSPIFAAILGIASIFLISWISPESRLSPVGFLGAFEDAGRMMVSVAIPSAAAGLIVGAIFYSGLAVRFSSSIINLAQGNEVLALLLAMLICIVLGMGITVTALYILVAALVVPALVELGFEPIAAHFFAFHFGVHSYITPPVALSAFAAAAISGSKPMATGFESMRLGLAAYLIPFMFVFSPALLGVGPWYHVLFDTSVAIVGVIALGSAIEGWFAGRLNPVIRVAFALTTVLIVIPDPALKAAGAAAAILIAAYCRFLAKPVVKEEAV